MKKPGVTTVLNQLGWNKEILLNWYYSCLTKGIDPKKYKDEAAIAGKYFHKLCECYLTNTELTSEQKDEYIKELGMDHLVRVDTTFQEFEKFINENKIEIIDSEKEYEEEKYKGVIDIYANKDNIPVLIDIKTSKAIYDEMILQIAAYRRLLQKNGRAVDKCYFLHIIPLEYKLELVEVKEELLKIGEQIFERCLELYYFKKEYDLIKKQ